MTDSRDPDWKRIESIFDQALDLDEERRAELLNRSCGDDSELRRAVERLLEADANPVSFLDEQAVDFARPMLTDTSRNSTDVVGLEVGPYRIVREIGRGGMGRVYIAERVDGQFEQQVAVKLIRSFGIPEGSHQRFLQERQILARLQHPGIARLLDGGTTTEGRPYLVMEYVDGHSIDKYCDSRHLSISDRLRLFRDVCKAVHFAHGNLVVHRDLKPNNILVTDRGQVKLLDFGIAKLLSPDADTDEVEGLTRSGIAAMTPEYAAPEQIRGGSITTATDVYSLGVILYELLCGHRPYRVTGLAPAEIERLVCDTEPSRPSTAATQMDESATHGIDRNPITPEAVSRSRSTQPDRLRRRLIGDLDMIVARAMDKEPSRRYSTAAELAQDLDRHLAGLPVTARGDTFSYRVRKFLIRHYRSVAVVAAFILLLAAYALTVTRQATQIRSALGRAEVEAERAEEVSAFLMGIFKSSDPRVALGDTVSVHELLSRSVDRLDDENENTLATAQMRDVLGQVYRSLGDFDEARALLDRALEIRIDLLGADNAIVAETRDHLGWVLADLGDYEGAQALFDEAFGVRKQYYETDRVAMSSSLFNVGYILGRLGDNHTAAERLGEALAIRREVLGPDDPEVATTMNTLAMVSQNLGRYPEAETLHREALEIHRRLLGDSHPDVVSDLNNLAYVLMNQSRFSDAEPLFRQALTLRRLVLGDDHPDVARSLGNLGSVLQKQGKYVEAERFMRQALDLHRKRLGDDHPDVGTGLNNLGVLYLERGDYRAAEEFLRESAATYRRALGPDHIWVTYPMNNVGFALLYDKQYDAAEAVFRDVLAMRLATMGDDKPAVAESLGGLGEVLCARGDFEAGIARFDDAIRIYTDRLGPDHWYTAVLKSGLGSCYAEAGRFGESEALLLGARVVLQSSRGPADFYVRMATERLVSAYKAWGKPDEVRQWTDSLGRGN
ncbi:MAG: serine/threonine protein kinase [Bacteroidetes bacterium]|nr:serine/threonine protein kinase [Bacteroidota bacterium]